MKKNEKIVGFRRVRGRVIPISGHIAGNAAVAAVGLGVASSYILKNAKSELKKAKFATGAAANLRRKTFETYNIVKSARRAKLTSSKEFLQQRNAIHNMIAMSRRSSATRKVWVKKLASEIRLAHGFRKAAIGFGLLSSGALIYQGLTNGKDKR